MISVLPIHFLPGNRWARIRELCGRDELSVCGTRSVDAIQLLDRILLHSGDSDSIVSSSALLPVSDRDRLITAVFINTFGSRIESTVTCSVCNTAFDISLNLSEGVNELTNTIPTPVIINESDYPFRVSDYSFRLPNGLDEMSVMGMESKRAEDEMMRRCLPDECHEYEAEVIQKTMEEIAPLADSEFEAKCPECSGTQLFHVNIQTFLLSSVINERDKLNAEIHLLTRYYGWNLTEILELPRSMRLSFVSLAGS